MGFFHKRTVCFVHQLGVVVMNAHARVTLGRGNLRLSVQRLFVHHAPFFKSISEADGRDAAGAPQRQSLRGTGVHCVPLNRDPLGVRKEAASPLPGVWGRAHRGGPQALPTPAASCRSGSILKAVNISGGRRKYGAGGALRCLACSSTKTKLQKTDNYPQ
jgi:hypothetical protein